MIRAFGNILLRDLIINHIACIKRVLKILLQTLIDKCLVAS